jgi:prevent-host-death family protein
MSGICLTLSNMSTVSARDLGRKTADVLDEVEQTGRPTLVVRNGRPVAALVPVNEADLEDFILATAPEYLAAMGAADEALAAGLTTAAADLFAELDEA